jgi:hypothetical protein
MASLLGSCAKAVFLLVAPAYVARPEAGSAIEQFRPTRRALHAAEQRTSAINSS